jgi:tetratricopeptide (TPR) repeat protein
MPRPAEHGQSRKGTWAVAGLILVSLVAGAVAMAIRHGPDGGPRRPNAFDADAADRDSEMVEQSIVNAFTDRKFGQPQVNAARELAEEYPQFARAHRVYGQALEFDGRKDAAYAEFCRALTLDPEQAELQLVTGAMAVELGRLGEAAEHCEKAVELSPKTAIYRVHLANVYFKQKDFERAKVGAQEAIQLDFLCHQGYALLSDIAAQQGNMPLALQQVQKAIDHTPVKDRKEQVTYIRKEAALLRRDGRPGDALHVLDDLRVEERARPEVLEDMGRTLEDLGRPAEAAERYESALADDPTDWRLAAGAAHWRIRAGDRKTAQIHIDTLRRINPRLTVIRELEDQMAK